MADTSHAHGPSSIPVEGDGINYRGIVWFVVILVGTTVGCQLIVWGLFEFMSHRAALQDTQPAPMAITRGEPSIQDGRVMTANPVPGPTLMVTEPLGLKQFRDSEDAILTSYGWVDKNAGTIRIPIEKAKELLLQRGIPGGVVTAPVPTVKKEQK